MKTPGKAVLTPRDSGGRTLVDASGVLETQPDDLDRESLATSRAPIGVEAPKPSNPLWVRGKVQSAKRIYRLAKGRLRRERMLGS